MQKCTRVGCNRAGDDLGDCPNRSAAIGCGVPEEVNKATDLVIRCKECGITRSVNVPANLMKGKSMPRCVGGTDKCKAIILPVGAK